MAQVEMSTIDRSAQGTRRILGASPLVANLTSIWLGLACSDMSRVTCPPMRDGTIAVDTESTRQLRPS